MLRVHGRPSRHVKQQNPSGSPLNDAVHGHPSRLHGTHGTATPSTNGKAFSLVASALASAEIKAAALVSAETKATASSLVSNWSHTATSS
eukprot:5139045-Prymnesium_polylepis.1